MTDPAGEAAPERTAEPSCTVRPLWEYVAEVGAPAAASAAEAMRRVATDEAVSRRPGYRSRPVASTHDTPGAVASAHDGTPASPLPGVVVEPPFPAPAVVDGPVALASPESGIPARFAAVEAVLRSVEQTAVPTSSDGENAYRPTTAR
ncbi:hypothetical protein [Kitasatospora sp. NPDC056531]|uniref:hypothetical protein n=1 Tax=Kitasatospora sp. NPDC056531 TaxID=3345856 RepID=UPI00368D77C0